MNRSEAMKQGFASVLGDVLVLDVGFEALEKEHKKELEAARSIAEKAKYLYDEGQGTIAKLKQELAGVANQQAKPTETEKFPPGTRVCYDGHDYSTRPYKPAVIYGVVASREAVKARVPSGLGDTDKVWAYWDTVYTPGSLGFMPIGTVRLA